MTKKNNNKTISAKVYIKIAMTFISFILFAIFAKKTNVNLFLLAFAMFAVNGLLWLVSDKLYDFFSLKLTSKAGDLNDPILQNITLQFIKELYLPILICSDTGRIIYCNDSLYKHIPTKTGVQFPKNIDEICNTDINTIISSDAQDGVEVNAFNKVFSIK